MPVTGMGLCTVTLPPGNWGTIASKAADRSDYIYAPACCSLKERFSIHLVYSPFNVAEGFNI